MFDLITMDCIAEKLKFTEEHAYRFREPPIYKGGEILPMLYV